MPYIKQEDRKKFEDGNLPETNGDLNYVITSIIKDWIERKGANYSAYNNAIGALECAKLELYRRMVAPYEDKKAKENGDVY